MRFFADNTAIPNRLPAPSGAGEPLWKYAIGKSTVTGIATNTHFSGINRQRTTALSMKTVNIVDNSPDVAVYLDSPTMSGPFPISVRPRPRKAVPFR